jgi:hypothetical protein
MAILQALFALISRSAGKVLNAIFGWAVRALFGQTTSREQTFLSAVVGAAVAWPLLLLGVIFPRLASLLLAFAPIPKSVPAYLIRLVWLGLALVVPLLVGLVVATKAPPATPPEPFAKRMARGFPITIGLAAAFVIMFVSVPVMRFAAMVRGLQSASIPLVTDTAAYHRVSALLVQVLNAHGFALQEARPGWWVTAPTRILTWFGGDAFRNYVPQKLEFYRGGGVELSMYPSGLMLRGKQRPLTWAQGLIAEAVTHSDGFQTSAPEAQDLERQIRRVWKVFDEEPHAHTDSPRLLGRVDEIARDLGKLEIGFDDWQVLYRQVLQLERAVRGEPQLMEAKAGDAAAQGLKEGHMASNERKGQAQQAPRQAISTTAIAEGAPIPMTERAAAALSTGELIKEITHQVGLLATKQIDLAKTELRADIKSEVAMASGLGVGALVGLAAVNMLLVTVILALARTMPAWAAGLIVSGFLLGVAAIAALVGWSKRVRTPMERTRRTLKEDVQWTKERLA